MLCQILNLMILGDINLPQREGKRNDPFVRKLFNESLILVWIHYIPINDAPNSQASPPSVLEDRSVRASSITCLVRPNRHLRAHLVGANESSLNTPPSPPPPPFSFGSVGTRSLLLIFKIQTVILLCINYSNVCKIIMSQHSLFCCMISDETFHHSH